MFEGILCRIYFLASLLCLHTKTSTFLNSMSTFTFCLAVGGFVAPLLPCDGCRSDELRKPESNMI